MKCINCGGKDAKYQHSDGGMICDKCVGHYFTCPKCGVLFNNDDYEKGDAGNGFCVSCTRKED